MKIVKNKHSKVMGELKLMFWAFRVNIYYDFLELKLTNKIKSYLLAGYNCVKTWTIFTFMFCGAFFYRLYGFCLRVLSMIKSSCLNSKNKMRLIYGLSGYFLSSFPFILYIINGNFQFIKDMWLISLFLIFFATAVLLSNE